MLDTINVLRFSFLMVCVVLLCTGEMDTFEPRITNGTIAEREKWPFAVALFFVNPPKFFCGGTIISERHILTAAHCVHSKISGLTTPAVDLAVRLGAYNLTDNNEKGSMESKVAQICVHQGWNNTNEDFDGDVAILVLENKITYTNYIQPVDLPPDNVIVDGSTINVTGIVVGWGLADKQIHEPILKEATIPSLQDGPCYRANKYITQLSSARTFCAGNGTGVPNKGDSGGGYFVYNGWEWEQYGIVSAINLDEKQKVVENAFSVYGNVKSYKQWIIATVNETMDFKIKLICNFGSLYEIYLCRLRDLDIQSYNSDITEVIGSHETGKTLQDVQEIKFETGKVASIPNGIEKFFTNLVTLTVGPSLGMEVIERSNLKSFTKLKEISIYNNEIKMLDEETLWDLPSLQIFKLIRNKLKFIHENTFVRNVALMEVNLQSNQLELLPKNLFSNNILLERIDFSKNSLKIIEIDFSALSFAKSFIFKNNVCIDFNTSNEDKTELQRLINASCKTLKL